MKTRSPGPGTRGKTVDRSDEDAKQKSESGRKNVTGTIDRSKL